MFKEPTGKKEEENLLWRKNLYECTVSENI